MEEAPPPIVYGLVPADDLEPDGATIGRMDRLVDVPQPDLLRWVRVCRKSDGKGIRRKAATWNVLEELLVLDGEAYQFVRHGPLWYTTLGPFGGRLLSPRELKSMALDLAFYGAFGRRKE